MKKQGMVKIDRIDDIEIRVDFYKKIKTIEPSDWELCIYEEMLSDSYSNVLLLGATPSLRLLLKDREVTVCDFDENQVQAMTRLVDEDLVNENIVIGNWLDVPFLSGSFNMVIGDCAINMIEFTLWDQFLRNIIDSGDHDTYFIQKIGSRPKDSIGVREYIHRFYDVESSGYLDIEFLQRRALNSEGFYDDAVNKSYKTRFNQALYEEVIKLGLNLDDFVKMRRIPNDDIVVIPPLDMVENKLNSFFKIIDRQGDLSHPVYGNQHIYKLRKP